MQNIKYIILKLSKAILYLILAIIIVILTMKYINRNDVWVDFATNSIRGKIKVPEVIVTACDCKKFTQWQFDNLPQVMHGLCPWYEFKTIYEVYIDDMLLHIPRKYMLLPGETDSKTNMISTKDFVYPTLESSAGNHPDSFWFSLYEDKEDDRFDNRLQRFFWCYFGIHRPKENKHIIKKTGFHEKIGMNQYTIYEYKIDPNMIRGTFYSNDEPDNIQDFIACHSNKENSQCKSFFKYKNIYVAYRAEQHLFFKPHNLRAAVIKIIQKWEVKNKPESK